MNLGKHVMRPDDTTVRCGAGPMNRWLITGAGGLLGRELAAFLRGRTGEHVIALDRLALDICDRDAVEETLCGNPPDIVVNCAAWTAADEAEDRESEALAVNGHAVGNLAGACAKIGAKFVHVSTDYVFEGTADNPYGENDLPQPQNAYGRTKLVGERAVREILPESGYIVRTAWLYGMYGPNFVRTMMNLERELETVEVVDDQIGQPTWARDLAGRIVDLHRSGAPAGVYHGTNSGQATWYRLAREVFRLLGADPGRVLPIASAQRNDRAKRPAYSVLAHGRWLQAGLRPMPEWRYALREALPMLATAELIGHG